MNEPFETRKALLAERDATVRELDPFATYEIHTGNRGFSAKSNGLTFVDGLGTLHGLEAGADSEEQAERLVQLRWFANAEPKEVTLRIEVDPRTERRTAVYGWRMVYRLSKKDGVDGKKVVRKEAVTA